MKTNINASSAMMALIETHLAQSRRWPWSKPAQRPVDAYRLVVHEHKQRVSGRIIVDGRSKKVGRTLRNKLSEQYFYDQRPTLWQHIDRVYAQAPASLPAAPVQGGGLSGLAGIAMREAPVYMRPESRGSASRRPDFERAHVLPPSPQRLILRQATPSHLWAETTDMLVGRILSRSRQEATQQTARPKLELELAQPSETWAEHMMRLLHPNVRDVGSVHGPAQHVAPLRHTSFKAELFEAATFGPISQQNTPPLVPMKSPLRKPKVTGALPA